MQFKFKWVDENGQEQGFFSSKGSLEDETLTLDDASLPVWAVVQARQRFNRLILFIVQEGGGVAPACIAVTSGSALDIMKAIHRKTSKRWLEQRKASLEEEGRGGELRTERCLHCDSYLDLTGMPETEQLYCRFCDSLVTRRGDGPRDEEHYRGCDECGLYARPEEFLIFYFYFLLVVYGFSQRKVSMCHSCMRGEAWKMLAGNLLFVLGVPVALYQLSRCYFGGSARSAEFQGLDNANKAALAGDIATASRGYEAIADRVSNAGVLTNHGLAYARRREWKDASERFEAALMACSNYVPAYDGLKACYAKLGEERKLRQLLQLWGDDEDGEGEDGALEG